MILVTGASGKTGLALLRQLRQRGVEARALVHRAQDVHIALEAGASEAVPGDMLSIADLENAMRRAASVYHICPNMHPDEVGIAQAALSAARRAGVDHFVYHSVLHPQTRGMAHHWNKLQVEELIFESGLPFTILQPCAYMQNIQGYWSRIMEEGVFAQPYSIHSRISMVDLEDVAEAAARVLSTRGHEAAIYELAGPQPLSQLEITHLLSAALGREIRAEQIDRGAWEQRMRAAGMADYAINTLLAMFVYYEQFGLVGNPNILTWLLGRPTHTFSDYIPRLTAGG